MKNRVIFIILAVSLLLNPQAVLAEEDDISSISFSSQLRLGDSYTWQINNGSSILGFSSADTVTFEIIGDTSVNIFEGDDILAKLNSIFRISINNDTLSLDWDDIVYWFICPIDTTYENGNQVNAADNLWIAFVYDDFYFNDAPYTVSTIGDLVTYSGEIEYEYGEKGYFDGVVNRVTGLVQSLTVSYVEKDGTVTDFADLNLLNADKELTLAFLPLDTLPFAFSIAILAIIMRKRKITN